MRWADAFCTVVAVSSDPPTDGPLERITGTFNERRWTVVVTLAAVVGLAAIVLALGPHPNQGGPRLTLALLACGPVFLLRRWPLPVLAAAVAPVAVVIALGAAPLPLAVLLALATYLVASQMPRRVSIPATVAAAMAIGGALVYAALRILDSVPIALLAIEGLVPLGAAWFVGDAVAARRRYEHGLRAGRTRADSGCRTHP